MAIYSHSRLATFEQCPLKYRYAYLDGVKMKKDYVESFLGSRFHETMEHLYERVPDKTPSLEELTAFFNSMWDEKWHDKVIFSNKEKDAGHYRSVGIRAIADYYRRYAPFDSGRVAGLEREVRFNLDETGGHQLRCIIDRLMRRGDGVFELHDYKTSASLPVQDYLDNDRQLALYEMAVRDAWPDTREVELIWHYVAFDMEMRSRRTKEQLDKLRQNMIQLIDRIEATTEFPPHESELCKWCDFMPICPLFAHRFRVETLPLEQYAEEGGVGIVNKFASLEEERHELSERIKHIEAELERLKHAAIGLAEREGVSRLFGDSQMLTIRDDIRVTYPKKGELARTEFQTVMKGLGLWEDALDISYSSIKSMAMDRGWQNVQTMPGELKELLKVEHIKQLRLAKRKDLPDSDE